MLPVQEQRAMTIMRRIQKGTSPPNVGGGVRNVKKKYIDQNQKGDTASKGIETDCGTMIRSKWHRTETRPQMQQLMESIRGIGTHCQRGGAGAKEMADEGEYNHSIILKFCK